MECKHYIRWYSPVCLECFSTKKYNDYMCHHCHNEEEAHEMDRHKVIYMKCNLCHIYQKKSNKCINPDCYAKEHNYYCSKCSLWEHKINKDIHHCDGCGICRIGKKGDFKHCYKCNICWNINVYDNHPCKIDQKQGKCLICLDSCWDSQVNPTILQCGHIFHPLCVNQWFQQNYTCPICKKSAYKPIPLWGVIENYVSNSELPEEQNNWKTIAYCNDCEKKTESKYHPAYHKCQECNSWNTQIEKIIK